MLLVTSAPIVCRQDETVDLTSVEAGQVAALGNSDEIMPRYLAAMYELGESDDISDLAS